MTIAEYIEYEAELKKQSKRSARGTNKVSRPLVSECRAIYNDSPTELHKASSMTNVENTQDEEDVSSKILPYLTASVNVIPKSMFEFLKHTHLRKTNMLVEMADMTKKAHVGIVENVLVNIDLFLFPSDFVVINMLVERNKTIILGRPFLETIHAEINVFNKEISLGVGEDRITFDMDKKIHNFTTHVKKIHIINSKHNGKPSNVITPPYKAHVHLEIKGHSSLHDQKNSTSDNEDMQGQCGKKARIDNTDPTILKVQICRPVKQDFNETFKIWPTCNPTMKVCNEVGGGIL
nr:hypothetical protein [Tanacetum cinerariifolium]